ncbi:MAG: methyltransferase domain-containing protein [Terriglobales bacterium]
MKRIPTLELLDTDAGTPAEVAASLADLRRINRWFGGTGTTVRLVQQVAQACGAPGIPARRTGEMPVPPSFPLSLLEVASGSGYVPRAARDRLAKDGIHLDVTLLDRHASHVGNGGRSVVGDALTLPFRDSSFDVVSSVLFAHHLFPDELVRFVEESLRVCRKAVLINDLIRHPIHLALVYSGFPLYRSRLTRNDAPASVRQAYTREEMRDILSRTNAARVEIDSYYLYRMGVIAWKQ